MSNKYCVFATFKILHAFLQETEPEPVKKESTEFTLKLVNFDASSKVKLIKEIKNLMPDMNLVQVCQSHQLFLTAHQLFATLHKKKFSQKKLKN